MFNFLKGSTLFLNIIAFVGGVVIFSLPASYWFDYRQVLIADSSIPTFQSETWVKRSVTIKYNDKLYCESQYIPTVGDVLSRTPTDGFVFGAPWGIHVQDDNLNLNDLKGEMCRLKYEARPVWFGFIQGRLITGWTEYFTLGE